MIEGKLLFTGRDQDGEPSYAHHLAQMVAVVGSPLEAGTERSSVATDYFDGSRPPLTDSRYAQRTLEEQRTQIDGVEKVGFLKFIRRMLCWVPEHRQTAHQLLQDHWLNS